MTNCQTYVSNYDNNRSALLHRARIFELLSLPRSAHLYVVAHPLHRLHSQFDYVLSKILLQVNPSFSLFFSKIYHFMNIYLCQFCNICYLIYLSCKMLYIYIFILMYIYYLFIYCMYKYNQDHFGYVLILDMSSSQRPSLQTLFTSRLAGI